MKNANKCPKIPYSAIYGEENNEKVIRNPHADADHHQKLIKGSFACLPSLVDVRFRICELFCSQNDRQTDRQTDRQNDHTARLVLSPTVLGVNAITRDVCLSVSKITQKRVHGF